MTDDGVRAYYERYGEREWERLTRPADGAIEFAVNRRIIGGYLQQLPPGSGVLDLGGGPGRYTIWLAGQGHRVTLAELSPRLIGIARRQIEAAGVQQQVEEAVQTDARDLSRWPEASFDAVLALGPFYHLPDPTDRDRAARELARVLRPGGLAFIALMPRLAFLRRVLAIPAERHLLTQPAFLDRVLREGVFLNDRPGAFTGGYGVRPEEVTTFFAGYGLTQLCLASSQSIASSSELQEPLARLEAEDPASYETAIDVLVQNAAEPSILGAASHLLFVGKKGDGPESAYTEPV
jgi:SAM-dependent methyltransferase